MSRRGRRHTYGVWQRGREIAGYCVIGPEWFCRQWARMMGGEAAGYVVEVCLCV